MMSQYGKITAYSLDEDVRIITSDSTYLLSYLVTFPLLYSDYKPTEHTPVDSSLCPLMSLSL